MCLDQTTENSAVKLRRHTDLHLCIQDRASLVDVRDHLNSLSAVKDDESAYAKHCESEFAGSITYQVRWVVYTPSATAPAI